MALDTVRCYLCGGNAVNKADLLEAFFTQSQAHFPSGIDFLMDNFECISSFIDLILQIEVHIAAESFHLHAEQSRQLVGNSSYKYLIRIFLQSRCRNPSCTSSFALCDDRNSLNRILLVKWHKKKSKYLSFFSMLTYRQPLSIEENFDILCGSSNIKGSSRHQCYNVLIQNSHFEFGQIRLESDTGEIISIKVFQLHFSSLPHIVCPSLRKEALVSCKSNTQ